MFGRMSFYCNRDTDGNIHVQNVLGGRLGQHHVHTPAGFEEWKREGDEIHWLEADPCDCGLTVGQTTDGWPK